jgi:ABC-type arginine/histidine transport system permease subunit
MALAAINIMTACALLGTFVGIESNDSFFSVCFFFFCSFFGPPRIRAIFSAYSGRNSQPWIRVVLTSLTALMAYAMIATSINSAALSWLIGD